MFQSKEQDKTSGKEVNKMEINYLTNKEFQVRVIKLLMELKKWVNALRTSTEREKIQESIKQKLQLSWKIH